MSFSQKWELAQSAQKMVRDAVRRRVTRQNPSFAPDEIEREVSRFLARART